MRSSLLLAPAVTAIIYALVTSACHTDGKAGATTPAQELATFKLPPGFQAELIAAEDPSHGIGKFVPIAFDQKGALWTSTALERPVDVLPKPPEGEDKSTPDTTLHGKGKDKVLVYDRDPKSATGYASKPRVFAEGLVFAVGVLPDQKGCYVQDGLDFVFLEDTDGDGKADKRTVMFSLNGYQDLHLLPHQFTRAPGGWFWLAVGAFPYDQNRQDKLRIVGARLEGTGIFKGYLGESGCDLACKGPCNVWGLVLNGEGDAFIQDSSDSGFPVVPFFEGASYPACDGFRWNNYAPEFPAPAADFRMGGGRLGGLALTDTTGPFPEPWRDTMLVANPDTNRIQAIKMHRDGASWKLDKPVDFLVSSDPMFRPVAISIGPDGCLYIVDWYNDAIPRDSDAHGHPDTTQARGRIWRVKATEAKPFNVPDLTKLSADELIAKLGGSSLCQSHLAWQTLGRRTDDESLEEKLKAVIHDTTNSPARRIQALWAMQGIHDDNIWIMDFPDMARDGDPLIRRALVRMEYTSNHYTTIENASELQPIIDDPDPIVRAYIILTIAKRLGNDTQSDESMLEGVKRLVYMARAPLAAPVAPSIQTGKPIKVREAYDREYERFLIRQALARVPKIVAMWLDTPGAELMPLENRLLAALALEPKESARRVAGLLTGGDLVRPATQEEMLLLAQFPEEPGVRQAFEQTFGFSEDNREFVEAVLALRTKVDVAKLRPLLIEPTRGILLNASTKYASGKYASGAFAEPGLRLASGYQLRELEPLIAGFADGARPVVSDDWKITGMEADSSPPLSSEFRVAALRALREMGSDQTELLAKLARTSKDARIKEEALGGLAASGSEAATKALFALWPELSAGQRHRALTDLAATKAGANAIVTAVTSGSIPAPEVDASVVDRMKTALSPDDPAVVRLVEKLGATPGKEREHTGATK